MPTEASGANRRLATNDEQLERNFIFARPGILLPEVGAQVGQQRYPIRLRMRRLFLDLPALR